MYFDNFNLLFRTKTKKRKELGIPENATLFLTVGELNKNKNHETVIRAIADMDVYYVIVGTGELHGHLQSVIDELKIANRVKLLGYRNDVTELYPAADIYILPSFREGLNVSVMEAMASGIPVICSAIRGNVEMVSEEGGALFKPQEIRDCAECIQNVLAQNLATLGAHNSIKAQYYDVRNINAAMSKIYFGD